MHQYHGLPTKAAPEASLLIFSPPMLKKPLTKKSVREAFSQLSLSEDAVSLYARGSEAQVEGSWSRARLARTFKDMGFKPADEDGYAFVNESRTVGMVLLGVKVDVAANRFRAFNFEIQARSLAEARQEDRNPNPRLF